MSDNNIKTIFFHNMIFDLKGHIMSKKAIYVYLFSSNNSSVKPTLPLMLPPNCMCASQPDSH